jgi:hypothetical protein
LIKPKLLNGSVFCRSYSSITLILNSSKRYFLPQANSAFYYFKIYKGGKAKAPKQSVSDDDEDDETEIEDPNDDEKSETDDIDE